MPWQKGTLGIKGKRGRCSSTHRPPLCTCLMYRPSVLTVECIVHNMFFPNVAYECYNDPCFPSRCGNCQVKRQQTAGEQKHIPPLHRNMKELRLIKPVYVHQTTHTHRSACDAHTMMHTCSHICWSLTTHTRKNKRHWLSRRTWLLTLSVAGVLLFLCV